MVVWLSLRCCRLTIRSNDRFRKEFDISVFTQEDGAHMNLWGLWSVLLVFIPSMVKRSKPEEKVVKSSPKTLLTNGGMSAKLLSVLEAARKLPVTKGGWKVVDGLNHLISSDQKFAKIIEDHGYPQIYEPERAKDTIETNTFVPTTADSNAFHSLLKTIAYQQLAGKAAESVFRRFTLALGLKEGDVIAPEQVLKAKFELIQVDGKRKITVNGEIAGLSESKSKYMQDLALHFNDETKLKGVDLSTLTDEELFNKLVAVKGLGPWSVQMYMMFQLHRANVLAPGDLGIRRGLCLLHDKPVSHFESAKQQLEIPKVCSPWVPYSTLGCWYMWKLSEQYMNRNKKSSTAEGEEEDSGEVSTSRSYSKTVKKEKNEKKEVVLEEMGDVNDEKRVTRKRKAPK